MSETNPVSKHYAPNKRNSKVARDIDRKCWIEVINMANQCSQITDLGHGFYDHVSPSFDHFLKETANESISEFHQYTRAQGHLRLVNAIAKSYSPFFKREIDPLNEVLVSIGGEGALNTFLAALCEEGDEVIQIEPSYVVYAPMTLAAGAVCRYVTLRRKQKNEGTRQFTSSSDWSWDEAELESAFNSRTKAIILNTPSNPLGKVYSRGELEKVAELCIRHNVLCIADEAYQHIVYEKEHIRIATFPGMWDRTITVGTVGKIFGCTGAKMGFSIGPSALIKLGAFVQVNQFYCCPGFLQEVVARCFEHEFSRLHEPDCFLSTTLEKLRAKRDKLVGFLIEAGLEPVVPDGGFLCLADISKLTEKNFAAGTAESSAECKDVRFVKFLIRERFLAAVPATVFYSDANRRVGENFVRFNFFKDDATLEKAGEILKSLNE